jgi:MoxR-like ATPase
MHGLSDMGPLKAAAWRQGRRVPVATLLNIGDIEIPALEEPRLLLVPENVTRLQQMWDSLRMPGRNNLLITGESGSGKTVLIRYLGEIYRQALLKSAGEGHGGPPSEHTSARAQSFQTRILTFHENLRRSDITERRHYGESGEDKTGWTMSDVMDGMVAGDWNVLSEINRTGEDVQAEFNEPLENKSKSLHQQVIRGHPDSRFIATVNPVKSEGRGIYEGKVMSGEFVNRFTNKVHLGYLPSDQEFEVLKSYGPNVSDGVIDRLVALASDIRRDYAEEHGVVPFPITTRALIRVIRHLEHFPGDSFELRSLFWRKAYWLDDRIHPPIARKLITDLLDLHDITDCGHPLRERSGVIHNDAETGPYLMIGAASHPLGPGGPYVPDTMIEEVQQNLADLEWVLKDVILQESILLIGEAGVGKNKLESYLAHLLRYNLLVVGMSGETRVSDLLTYRSFGEEEVGKTGDTATLGLRALTDPDHGWIIVLDEANKAHPGVLVSFNDLLQDRLVRLPGGSEAPVRATICVNINPNRPPYEVNDFSFEFMDRFSIHTILHLPADQAVDVLKKKYPDADEDFIRDVVNGYYALHPLYSTGILFEPVTMRNEEAAIERGLQYPGQACNLIDLICTCYGPRDGRELHAIQGALQGAGFDRNVLPASWALEKYRTLWEEDKGSEEKAITLAETYRDIGKPTAAKEVLREMLTREPERDWVYHLKTASIHLDDDDAAGAEREILEGFLEGSIARMDNCEKYVILCADTTVTDGSPEISVEVQNVRTATMALVTGRTEDQPKSFYRLAGNYRLAFSDMEHGLAIYECPGELPSAEGKEPKVPGTPACNEPGKPATRYPMLRSLVSGSVMMGWSDPDFRRQICRFPSPPWSLPEYTDGCIVREYRQGGEVIRLVARQDPGWSIESRDPAGRMTGMIGWNAGEIKGTGEFFFTPDGHDVSRIQSPDDPFLQLNHSESMNTVYLVLPEDLASRVNQEAREKLGNDRGITIEVISAQKYHEKILLPLFAGLFPRLQRIFRYSRPLKGHTTMGAGDILYTIQPDSRIGVSLVVETSGTGTIYREISPGGVTGIPKHGNREVGGMKDAVLQQTFLPFTKLDTCEEWLDQAISQDVQGYLQETRKYITSAFLKTTQPRDITYEARTRSVLAGYRHITGTIGKETTLRRGDILVRTSLAPEETDHSKYVFIVQFMQEGTIKGLERSQPVVRGFWLGEQNPVATEDFGKICGEFGLIVIEGDDKYDQIVRQLVISSQDGSQPVQYSRTGTRSDPVEFLKFGGLEIDYHPSDRRFRVIIEGKDETTLSLEETGYPAETTIVKEGNRELLRWQGTPFADIRYQVRTGQIMVILEEDFYSVLIVHEMIETEAFVRPGGISVVFISRSDAGLS